MKKILVLFLSLIIISFFTSSLKAEEKYDLSLNLEQGNTYQIDSFIRQSLSVNLFGSDISMVQEIESVKDFEVLEITDDNNYIINVKYREFKMNITDIEGDLYDDLAEQEPEKELEDIASHLEDFTFTIEITPYAKIINIEGFDELKDKIIEDTDQELELLIEEYQFEDVINQSISYIPEYPVSPGESWESSLEYNYLFSLISHNVFTLNSVQENKIIIDIESDFEPGDFDLLMDFAENDNIEINFEIDSESNQKGHFVINKQNNWIKEAFLEQKLSGTLFVKDKESNISFRIPVKMDSVIEIKGS